MCAPGFLVSIETTGWQINISNNSTLLRYSTLHWQVTPVTSAYSAYRFCIEIMCSTYTLRIKCCKSVWIVHKSWNNQIFKYPLNSRGSNEFNVLCQRMVMEQQLFHDAPSVHLHGRTRTENGVDWSLPLCVCVWYDVRFMQISIEKCTKADTNSKRLPLSFSLSHSIYLSLSGK